MPPCRPYLDPAALALLAGLQGPGLPAEPVADRTDLVAGDGQAARLAVVEVLEVHLELVPVVLSLAGALEMAKQVYPEYFAGKRRRGKKTVESR